MPLFWGVCLQCAPVIGSIQDLSGVTFDRFGPAGAARFGRRIRTPRPATAPGTAPGSWPAGWPSVSHVNELWLLGVLFVAVIVLTPLADVVRVPQPVLLTILGGLLGFLPGATPLEVEPEIILPLVLPPLLFAATQKTTAGEFREHAGAVLALAVGLTISTAAVVAVVAHAAGLGWTSAWVLGAVVSPPDPVAATAVARRLKLPHRLVTILEGEGMFNDATALVLYKVTVAALVTGAFSLADTGLEFVVTVVVGIAMGFAVGYAAKLALAALEEGYAETTVTVLVPFLGYIAAEELGGSGVLAVLVLGLLLRDVGHEATTSQGWLLGRSVWNYADFLITSLIFTILGYELVTVLREATLSSDLVVLSIAVVLTVVLFRFAWIIPVTSGWRASARRREVPVPVGWRETTVVAWSGMRGVVTVATALALPTFLDSGELFADRESVVVAALVCVMVTLLVQGLTLGPLTKKLAVASDVDEAAEIVDLRDQVTHRALEFLDGEECADTSAPVREAARLQYEGYLASYDAMRRAIRSDETDAADDDAMPPADELRWVLRRVTDAERDLVLNARRTGAVSSGSADEVLREIEGRALRDFG